MQYEELIRKADLCYLAAFRVWEKNRDQNVIAMWMQKRSELIKKAREVLL